MKFILIALLYTQSVFAIIGGKVADSSKYPWFTYIYTQSNSGNCGGIAVDKNHIITAAHCVHEVKSKDVMVFLTDTTGQKKMSLSKMIKIEKITIHPGYIGKVRKDWMDLSIKDLKEVDPFNLGYKNFIDYNHDIAILKTAKEMNDIEVFIDLATENSYRGESVLFVGWGRVSDAHHKTSKQLREVELKTLPSLDSSFWTAKMTRKYFESLFNFGILSKSEKKGYMYQIPFDATENKSLCTGDSGGPALKLERGSYTLVGVVSRANSFNGRCAGKANFATSISYHLDWIEENLND